jgi:hypothetical protein
MKNVLGKSLALLLGAVAIFSLAPTILLAAKPVRNITPIADVGAGLFLI